MDDMGELDAALLENHGYLVCGATVPECWEILYDLEQATKAHLAALSTGATIATRSSAAVAADKTLHGDRTCGHSHGKLGLPASPAGPSRPGLPRMMQPTRQHRDDDAVTPPATTEVARLELAALCRLLARERLTPIGGARVAARDPENQSSYLIHPAAPLFEEAKPSGMVTVDRDGVHQDTREREPDAGTLAIVLAALEARSDAAAAALIASTAGCVVASLEVGLCPLHRRRSCFMVP